MARRTADIDQMLAEQLRRRFWQAFTLDHDEADASRIFTARYGAPPTYIIETGGNLLLGPIPTGAMHQFQEPAS